MEASRFGAVFSVDEQTMGFKGNHVDEIRITYKKEFRNQPVPKKYLDQGLSPLHSRVMAMFDCLCDENHRCYLDNLYNSAKFCRDTYTHHKKV